MNKFNIGDQVRTIWELSIHKKDIILIKGSILEIRHYHLSTCNDWCYRFLNFEDAIEINESDLELIEQDTEEHTPTDKEIATDTSYEDTKEDAPQTGGSEMIERQYNENKMEEEKQRFQREVLGKQAPMPLDYEKEYNKLLEEHEELKELHEIALMMIKLGSELI
jgi:hypothetical protein